MPRGSVEIAARAGRDEGGMLLEKILARLSVVLLVNSRPPRFAPKRRQASEQPRILAPAVEGQMKLLVERFDLQRIVFGEQLFVEPFRFPQGGRRQQRKRLLQGCDFQNRPKLG